VVMLFVDGVRGGYSQENFGFSIFVNDFFSFVLRPTICGAQFPSPLDAKNMVPLFYL